MSVVYEIGPFRLDPEAGVLTRNGLPMALGARGVAVLTALVKVPNEYVRKASILDAAWPGVIVEENSLAAQISAIRRVLAGAPGGEHWIETLARRGYRFVGPVTELVGNLPRNAGVDVPRSNLPELVTSFIGRERDLVEIKRLLPATRLLTLVGVGGIGKTRFALQVAAEVIAAYRDGVWLVDLALLSDATLVPSAVAQVLGVRESAGKPILETLCAQVKGRQALLLLDNCEHVLDACAHLADALLRATAELTIVATSREPLSVAGEQTYSLPTLSLPDAQATVETVGRSEAVQLFMERAQQQHPDFRPDALRWPIVAQICIRLDGIPLALELAAARVRSLSVEQIHARLDDRFKLLTGGTRTALLRQQTLRATLDWSHDLLAERERKVLRRLAVFAGGFTLEAAASVGSDETLDEFGLTDCIAQLVARSLVTADTNAAGARYRLLETTRAYALERLAEAGEAAAIRRRHAQYFCDRFEPAPDDWLRMADAEWNATYLPELDNVRGALDWALAAGGDSAIGATLAGASGEMWVELSLYDEGARRLEAALAAAGSAAPALATARLWKGLGTLWGDGMEPEKAAAAFERAAHLFGQLDHQPGLGNALVQHGLMLEHMGRLEQASAIFEQALPALERADIAKAWSLYFNGLGLLMHRKGDPATARAHYERALAHGERAGAEPLALAILTNLTDATWTLGDLDAALAAQLEVIARLRTSPRARKVAVAICFTNLAGIQVERGDLDAALAAAREGLPLFKELGLVWYPLDHHALRAAMAGKIADAALLAGFADSAHAARTMSREPNEARAHARLQELLREKLAPDELERLLREGAKLSEDEACRLALED